MKKYISLITLLCLITACNNSEEERKQNGNSGQDKVMNINPDIPPMSRVTSTTDNSYVFEKGDGIGIFIVKQGEALYGNEYNYNTKFSKTSDGWEQSLQTTWLSSEIGSVNDVIGYYPYRETIEYIEEMPITLKGDQRQKADLSACDYLWGKNSATLTESNPPVSLTMKHIMTELVFQITLEGEYAAYNGIENLQIFAKNQGNLNLNNGKVTPSGKKTSVTPFLKTTADDGFQQTYKALIIPQEYADESFISFEMGGKTYTQSLKHELVQGKYYIFNLNLKRDPNLFLLSEGGIINNWLKESEDDFEINHETGSYQTGDLWPDSENPVAIVVKARKNSNPGILMSLAKENQVMYTKSYPFLNTFSEGTMKGRDVMTMMEQSIETNHLTWNEFPAFEYCHSLGKGWFIPNLEEAQSLLATTLKGIGLYKWFEYMGNVGEEVLMWTSMLTSSQNVLVGTCTITYQNGSYYYSIGAKYYPSTSSLPVRAFKYY